MLARQAPLSMGHCRQEYWGGLSCPPPGDLPDLRLNPGLLHCRQIILYDLSHLEALSLVCRFKTGLRRGCADYGNFIKPLEVKTDV